MASKQKNAKTSSAAKTETAKSVATKPTVAPKGPKVLRIGVIPNRQVARIDEEHFIPRGENVTIGQNQRNTLVFPKAKLPESFVLFQAEKNGYLLRFSEKMEGSVTIGGTDKPLSSWKASNAKKKADIYELSLDESCRGKLQLGEITILFQFVVPPATVAKQEIPAFIQGSLLSQIDKVLATFLLISFLIHSGLASFVFTHVVPEEVAFDEDNPLLVKVAAPPPAAIEEPEPEPEKVAEDKPAEKSKEPAGGGKKTETNVGAQNAKTTDVRTVGALAAIGRISAAGGSYEDFSNGSSAEDALNGFIPAGAAKVATAGDDLGSGLRGGDGAGGTGTGDLAGLDKNALGAKTNTTVGPTDKGEEKKIKGNAKVGGSTINEGEGGSIDSAAIASVLRRNQNGVQSCYERVLATNEGLQGKIAVQFTIGEAGRVTSVSATEDTVNSSEVTTCVLGVFKRMKFPENPGGGNVTASSTFVFTKSN